MHQLYQLGRTLIDAAQRARGATESGMSQSEFLVLRDLFINGQSSISEIVARTDLAQSRVSTCVQNLVERDWVMTATDPADGRKTLAQVTDRVKAEGMRRRTQDAQDALAPLLADCSPKDRRAITHALERLYELAVNAGDHDLRHEHLAQPLGRRSRSSHAAREASAA